MEYLAAARAALGTLPTQKTIVFERFFDESGGMQFVIHSPFGSRINRAWGLALRKRFCRKFNFELQAAATEDAIVLSLSTSHSFPLDEVGRYLHSASVRDAADPGDARRADVRRALALDGNDLARAAALSFGQESAAAAAADGGRRPAGRGVSGSDRLSRKPRRRRGKCPTIRSSIRRSTTVCTTRWTSRAWNTCCARSNPATIGIECRELTEPSPLALEILGARPYAFLDDAPLEERRTRAVMGRRWLDEETAAGLGRLDPDAIERVRAEAWPTAENPDELHDALLGLAFLTEAEVAPLRAVASVPRDADRGEAGDEARAVTLRERRNRPRPNGLCGSPRSACRSSAAVFPQARLSPPIAAPKEFAAQSWSVEDALVEIVRGRLQGLGPVTTAALADSMALPRARHRNGADEARGGRLRDERIVHARHESSPNGAIGRSSRAFIATP